MVSSRPRGTLFRKYAAYLAGLVSIALAASGAVSVAFGYRDTRDLVEQVQRERARGAAQRIEQFVNVIESQVRAELTPRQSLAPTDLQAFRFDLHRLLRQNPSIAELAWIDGTGIQHLKVSRVARDNVGVGENQAEHRGVVAALAGKSYFSPVYLRNASEPYLTLAVSGARRASGVLLAEVNLTFVWDVVSEIGQGAGGRAFVVDAAGRLISHPDLGLVLRRTDLSEHPWLRAALAGEADVQITASGSDGREGRHMTAQAPIPLLGWHVFVEQPLAIAFAPLYASLARTAGLLVLGIALAAVTGLVLARRMARPIGALEAGARRLGEGRLDGRVEVRTGDELEALADEFNRMAERLSESRTGLEQKVAERTRQLALANQAKSRFLAAASHDLRQPVHALGLYIAQLRQASTPNARERLLGKIEASSVAVSELIEALLDISKLDAGAVTPRPVAFAVQDLLNRLDDGFALAAQAKGLRLRVRPSSLRVVTDPMLLERIVWNLAANSLRYTREGGILIACRQRAHVARVEVWDTGIGIPSALQPRVFEEFYRAHPSPDSGQGLGLGLAIVERLAALLGLQVAMASKEGRGTMFSVEAALATAIDIAGAPAASQRSLRQESALALVVDDDADAREAAAGLLALWGWRVITAAGSEDALAALGEPPAQLGVILTDYRLAEGDLGTRLVERVRAACGAPVPALVLSGDVTPEVRELVLSAGLHLLHKPLQAARLRTLLHHLVHGEASDQAA